MADIEMVERRIDKAQKAMKGGDKKFAREVELFTELLAHLNAGKLARTFTDDADDLALIATSDLLTLKKTIYVANLSENEINEPDGNRHYQAVNRHYQAVKALAQEEGSQCLPICAKLEADIAELDDPEEKAMFMEELGVAESGLDRLIKVSYALLGLISFLTAGSDECRAWTIKQGTKAPQAAGKIHTDFERGFIRAEVIAFEDMKACGTMAAAKAKGLVRSEGKEYVMKDGDIVNFQCLPICAKLEADIAELDDPEEKAMFMEELGVAESGLDRLIKVSYALLGLISFLTAGSDECRAWTIKQGTKAPQAAGKIHTDFERGFIRAEVIAFEDMKACGTMAAAKAKGLVRSEGKEYVMKDGDIVNFLFNV